jgi:hypothetical protein
VTERPTPGIDFSAHIADRVKDFTGHEWVFRKIDESLTCGAPKFVIITGAPASGKTAIAAMLTRVRDLAAFHFCIGSQSITLDPVAFCESLALQLAHRWPVFAKILAEINRSMRVEVTQQFQESAGQVAEVVIKHLGDPREAFDRMVRRPLERLVMEQPGVSVVILVDGVDEALHYGGEITIMDLLAHSADLPRQVRFVLTSRVGPHLMRLAEAYSLSLDDSPAETAADLQAYASHYIASRVRVLPGSPAGRLVERMWVWQRIEAWLAEAGRPYFLLSGPAGSGKSTLLRQLEAKELSEHWGLLFHLTQAWPYFHTCRTGDDSTLDPVRFLQGLAGALASRYPAYSEALTRIDPTTQIKVEQTVGTAGTGARVVGVSIGTLSIGELNARVAFEHVVRRPLQALCGPDFAEMILIAVDALDEAQGYASNALANLIRNFVQPEARWPAQVRWLLTSRPDPRVIHLFGQPALDLVANAEGNDDVYLYAYDRLDLLADPDREALSRRVAGTAKGVFLYARYALDSAIRQIQAGQPWNTLELPAGLADQYRTYLRRELAEGLTDWQQSYRPLLGCLAVSQGSGLTRRQLAGIVNKDLDVLSPLLTASAQYLHGAQPDGPFRIDHQSFRDFLLEDAEFGIDQSEAHRKVAAYFIEAYADEWDGCKDSYALQYTPVHLVEAMRHLLQDADPPTRRKLAAQMRGLAESAGFWQSRRNAGLALESAYSDATLQAMLDIWSRHRQAKELLLPLLGILSVARAPLTAEQLGSITGLESARLLEGLGILRRYLVGDDMSGLSVSHRSLVTYLEDQSQMEHQRTAEYYLHRYAGRWAECDDPYGLGWLITHVVGGRLWQGLAAILADADFWKARLGKRGLPAATEDLRSAYELASATGPVRASLGGLLETLRLLALSPTQVPGANIAIAVEDILARIRDLGLDQPQSEVTTSTLPADLVDKVVEKSGGNFLYAQLLLQEIEREPSRAAAIIRDPPPDLAGFYHQSLYRLMIGKGAEQWRCLYMPVLGILAVAREPLTEDELAALSGINKSDLADVTGGLMNLLVSDVRGRDRRYWLFHGSFQRFLSERQLSQEFWIDPAEFHLHIAGLYWSECGGMWSRCDIYGLKNIATHYERGIQDAPKPRRHALVEQLVGVATDPDFQAAHEERLHDPFLLAGDLARATRIAVRDQHPEAPLVVVPAALSWAAFRGGKLNPRRLFELAGEGQALAALNYLDQYPIEPEWNLAARLIIAWLGVEASPSLARDLSDRLMRELPSEGPVRVLALRVQAALEGTSPLIRALPPAPPPEVTRALAGIGQLQDETTTLLAFGSPELGEEAPFYLADRDGPLLVAYAVAQPLEGTEYLRTYLTLHGASSYSLYRSMNLWRLLDAVLRHPDPAWSRAMAAEVAGAALTEPDVEFREGLRITIQVLQARAGQPGAAERLEELRQAALSEVSSLSPAMSGGDLLAHGLRRLITLAEGHAVALDRPEMAAVLVEHARSLPFGFAGFTAPALIELAGTMLLCGVQDVIIRQVLEEARIASHRIQDHIFCARSTAAWHILTRDWQNSGRDLSDIITSFAKNPGAPDFAALHHVGEPYAARQIGTVHLPLPDRLYRANTLRSLAELFGRPLSSVCHLNPSWDSDAPLPGGTQVSIPDPGLAPQLAARFAALVLAEPGLPSSEQTWLIQQLVPAAVGNSTALDTVLSRLLLAAKPIDLDGLAQLFAM